MNNPWVDLPETSPYVLTIDKVMIDAHNKHNEYREDYCFVTELLPVPFLGNPDTATVVLLGANPGLKSSDIYDQQTRLGYAEQNRRMLSYSSDYPFFYIDPAFEGAGGNDWWSRRLRDLIVECGLRKVAERTMCLQLTPYHSRRFKRLPATLPSQEYTYYLLNEAITQNKLIVNLWGAGCIRQWQEYVPRLQTWISLKGKRTTYVSRGNTHAADFERIVAAIRR